MDTSILFYILFGTSLLGIGVVLALFKGILRLKVDDAKAANIAKAIYQGAMTFLWEEYRVIAVVILIIAAILAKFLGVIHAGSFLFGAILSLSTGLIGMKAATLANVRTTIAAKNQVNMLHLWLHSLVAVSWVLRLQVLVCLV